MEEIWRPIPGFEYYSVSNIGRVKNPFGKVLKPSSNYKGYLIVNLSSEYIKHKQMFVHRAVALAFIPNPDNLPQVNHINHNKSDNNVENLEWCTNLYNQRYSHALVVNQYDLEGRFIKSWKAISDIESVLAISTTNISKCCKGEITTINNFVFLYDGDSIEDRLMMIRNKYKCKCRKIKAYNMDNVLQNTFDSVNEAASYYHFSPKSVIDCCKQRKYSNQEIIFRYA